ncbi:MAG TPA: transcription antitermination factor NusB [Thermoanaerobaculia bacterium]|nr:transcription antitermination factor NusB [Thermoanaerobaculia bacterium]
MSKHRPSTPSARASSVGPPPSRRLTPRRTQQDNVRIAAAWVLDRVLASHAPIDNFLGSALARFDERDQGLLTELALGSLRWLRLLDHVVARAANRQMEEIEPTLRSPLRIAAYQLLFLDRVPAHAAVHEAVEQVHNLAHRGAAGFVNAVLRRIARAPRLEEWPVEEADPVRRLGIELSHPDFLVRRWLARFGETDTRALLSANNRQRPLQLLAFRDRGGRELLAEQLIDEGLEVEPTPLSALGLTVRGGQPLATEAFRRGDFYVQDEASQASALIPPPRPGERILDAAAAPGGKSFSLLAWEPSVRLTLADISPLRYATLAANLRRLDRNLAGLIADAGAPPFAAGSFDRVVLDLPCTGTGTLRKNPELKWRISESEIGRLADQALRLLEGSAPLVAPGGLLIAITCSLEEEENEHVIARFLAERPEFAPLDLAPRLPPQIARAIQAPGFWRLATADEHDGFSVHVLEKTQQDAGFRAADAP